MKPCTYPILYNTTLQINISKLKGWGYLDPEQIKSGTLSWSSNGNLIAGSSIQVNIQSEHPYIELDYTYRNEPRNYKVYLTSIPSNLNKGKIWYFICPQTNKRCRKLYLIGGYFLHREAFNNGMYETQTESKSYREICKTHGILKIDEIKEGLKKKHFKKTYAGKPTKKYLQIMKKIQKLKTYYYNNLNKF